MVFFYLSPKKTRYEIIIHTNMLAKHILNNHQLFSFAVYNVKWACKITLPGLPHSMVQWNDLFL